MMVSNISFTNKLDQDKITRKTFRKMVFNLTELNLIEISENEDFQLLKMNLLM